MPIEWNAVIGLATLALVFVTAYYALANWKLVVEMRKERKIKFIENKLRYLYSPLRNCIVEKEGRLSFVFNFNWVSRGEDKRPYLKPEFYDRLFKIIENNIHLADSDLREALLLILQWNDNNPGDMGVYNKVATLIYNGFEKLRRDYIALTEAR